MISFFKRALEELRALLKELRDDPDTPTLILICLIAPWAASDFWKKVKASRDAFEKEIKPLHISKKDREYIDAATRAKAEMERRFYER